MKCEYEGFSKQDLLDRLGALRVENQDSLERALEIRDEVDAITKLLIEMK